MRAEHERRNSGGIIIRMVSTRRAGLKSSLPTTGDSDSGACRSPITNRSEPPDVGGYDRVGRFQIHHVLRSIAVIDDSLHAVMGKKLTGWNLLSGRFAV